MSRTFVSSDLDDYCYTLRHTASGRRANLIERYWVPPGTREGAGGNVQDRGRVLMRPAVLKCGFDGKKCSPRAGHRDREGQ